MWGVVDTIVSSTVGCGVRTWSTAVNANGELNEDVNAARDDAWERWCKVADINGELNWHEMQALAMRETAEAGECFMHLRTVPEDHKGIEREVPFAIELIDADRIDVTQDTMPTDDDSDYIERGIKYDHEGTPISYFFKRQAPNRTHVKPYEVPASDIIHWYRKDRIGQGRGVSWFHPSMQIQKYLQTYVENELQASAVASCYTAAITTEHQSHFPKPPSTSGDGEIDGDQVDGSGDDSVDYMQPGAIFKLKKGEKIEFGSPGRPNSASEPWIMMMLRGTAAGTGLSYETVSRDYSKTNFSSNRASQLEDRRRFRCWQNTIIVPACDRVRDRFQFLAATAGHEAFPSADEEAAPFEHQIEGHEWVDPVKEQKASSDSINNNLSTLQIECGKRGLNWRRVLIQRSVEERFKQSLDGIGESDEDGTENPAQGKVGTDRTLSLVEAVQKIYLGVGTVLTDEEARDHLREEYGIDIHGPMPEEDQVEPQPNPFDQASNNADGDEEETTEEETVEEEELAAV